MNHSAIPAGEVQPGTDISCTIHTAHAKAEQEILAAFGVRPNAGLDSSEVARRRHACGANRLQQAQPRAAWHILVAQFKSLIVYLLAAAAALSLTFGDYAEGAAIAAVLIINTALGFVTELRAIRSIEALREFSKGQARVRRDGKERTISADDIVPGDFVLLESGGVVPADIRLFDNTNLQCDESALTGESAPVSKEIGVVGPDTAIADRTNMAFAGTAVTRGSAAGVVVATGMATELGNIAALAESAESDATPLERRLDRLGSQLVVATLALTAVIGIAGALGDRDMMILIKTAVALAVAAIPEGLPIVATVALARGMWRLARRNVLIENLSSVETLGAITAILTDKTGTLTENRMAMVMLWLDEGVVRAEQFRDWPGTGFHSALRVAVLCNTARLPDHAGRETLPTGDPMEIALLAAGLAAGIDQASAREAAPLLREEAFSTHTRMMATFHETGDGCLVAVKGAPESVMACSTSVLTENGEAPFDEAAKTTWHQRNESMTRHGLRVIALARKTAARKCDDPYCDLTLIGLAGLLDPPRHDVAEAIAACRDAGVGVTMLTGDHAGTAKAIALQIGLADDSAEVVEGREVENIEGLSEGDRQRMLDAPIFARISPKAKLNLVTIHQQSGAIVAMTGDGVNDAPALVKADIGIAMGDRGTEVARQAADMVLKDDAFTSIVVAMRQGRVIIGNIRRFVAYLLACNLSEILVIGIAMLAGLPLPLLPLQILYLNLVTDVFPAFALGVGEGSPNIMKHPPADPKAPIISTRAWVLIIVYGTQIAAATLGAFVLAFSVFGMTDDEALTIAFLTLAFSQLWHVFNMHGGDEGPINNAVTGNPFVWAALVLCIGLIIGAVYLPVLSLILGITPPNTTGWALIGAASVTPLALGLLVRLLRRRRN